MSQKLFGTDGVRGKAGISPLDHETVARLGAALVRAMRTGNRPLRFLVGRDTRESGDWIERELGRGVHAEGGAITSAGVIPTPAIVPEQVQGMETEPPKLSIHCWIRVAFSLA